MNDYLYFECKPDLLLGLIGTLELFDDDDTGVDDGWDEKSLISVSQISLRTDPDLEYLPLYKEMNENCFYGSRFIRQKLFSA